MPKNEREWTDYTRELAKWVIKIAKLGDGSITTSGGTTISGLDEMPGVVASERSLPMVNIGNLRSVQSSASALSASDGGASATITIAGHTLATTSGDVTFNAGSVTGLSYETTYYVYADGGYTGGAVTYAATTDPTDLVGDLGRYYVGQITTGAAETTSGFSSITLGSPTTINTAAPHGFTSGWTVEIDNIVDSLPGGDMEAALNGNSYVATVTFPAVFTIPYDSSGLTNTYVSSGTATRVVTYPPPLPGGGGGGFEP